jgi:hypothetical protein
VQPSFWLQPARIPYGTLHLPRPTDEFIEDAPDLWRRHSSPGRRSRSGAKILTDSDNNDANALIGEIKEWLEKPQDHLDDQSRRRLLEALVMDHVAKIRRAERARVRGKDLVLAAAVLTIASPFVPRILALFGVGSE